METQKLKQVFGNARIVGLAGEKNCLSGETIIRLNRNGGARDYRLDYIFKQFHEPEKIKRKSDRWNFSKPSFVRSFNGELIRLNEIEDVFYSGKKEVWKMSLENGYEIKATLKHKFLTDKGWKTLSQIRNDLSLKIMCDTPNARTIVGKRSANYDFVMAGCFNHPYYFNDKGKTQCLKLQNLVFEANKNNLSLTEYINILRNEPKKSKTLWILPRGKIIHHKDGKHYNNNIKNLMMMNDKEHYKVHSRQCYSHFNQGVPELINIKSIEKMGVEDTYDIECKVHHNFNANGMIVHNSGKTNNLIALLEDFRKHNKETKIYLYGIDGVARKWLAKLGNVYDVSSIEQLSTKKDSLIIIDEFQRLRLNDRRYKDVLNSFIDFIYHNNNWLILSSPSLREFNSIIGSKIERWVLKSVRSKNLVNGSHLKNAVLDYNGQYKTINDIIIPKNKIVIINMDYEKEIHLDYIKEADNKVGLKSIF